MESSTLTFDSVSAKTGTQKDKTGPIRPHFPMVLNRPVFGYLLATLLPVFILMLITLPLTYLFYGASMLQKQGYMLLGGWDCMINWLFPALAIILLWFFKGATPGKMFTVCDGRQ